MTLVETYYVSLLGYLEKLSYRKMGESEGITVFQHEHTSEELLVRFGLKDSELPYYALEGDKRFLLIISEDEFNTIGLAALEKFIAILPPRVSVVVYEEDTIEHTMKDIWFFLNS